MRQSKWLLGSVLVGALLMSGAYASWTDLFQVEQFFHTYTFQVLTDVRSVVQPELNTTYTDLQAGNLQSIEVPVVAGVMDITFENKGTIPAILTGIEVVYDGEPTLAEEMTGVFQISDIGNVPLLNFSGSTPVHQAALPKSGQGTLNGNPALHLFEKGIRIEPETTPSIQAKERSSSILQELSTGLYVVKKKATLKLSLGTLKKAVIDELGSKQVKIEANAAQGNLLQNQVKELEKRMTPGAACEKAPELATLKKKLEEVAQENAALEAERMNLEKKLNDIDAANWRFVFHFEQYRSQ